LFNRRYFFENLETEVQRARRYRRAFTILMLDLDHFKHYNDTHGHLCGDQVLRQCGEILLGNTRRADVVARFGGEEFVIMLPEIDRQAGALVAEKIRAKIAQHPFHGRDRQPGGELTVTIGLATYPIDSDNGLQLVDVADRALYVGKRQGNCVVLSSEQAQHPHSRHEPEHALSPFLQPAHKIIADLARLTHLRAASARRRTQKIPGLRRPSVRHHTLHHSPPALRVLPRSPTNQTKAGKIPASRFVLTQCHCLGIVW
jgi:diguanylate cyclase (GGDEF)-like protein